MSDSKGVRAGLAGFRREMEAAAGEIEPNDPGVTSDSDDVDARPRFRGVRLLGKCEHCGMPLPLLGPLREIPCAHCQEINRFSGGFWGELIDALDDHPSMEEWSHHVEVDANTAAPPEELSGSAADPPDWLKGPGCTIHAFYGALHEGQSGGLAGPDVDEQAPRPVAMACPKCGAGLEITVESPRNATCDYCKTDVYLPDALWLKLHPIKKATRWYVEYRGLSRATRGRRRQSEEDYRRFKQDQERKRREAEIEEQARLFAKMHLLREQRSKLKRHTLHGGFFLAALMLSGITALPICAGFGDALFGLQGVIVCPQVCETCTGPYFHTVLDNKPATSGKRLPTGHYCRSKTGAVPGPEGTIGWVVTGWVTWFVVWLGLFIYWVAHERKKVFAERDKIDARIAELKRQAAAVGT